MIKTSKNGANKKQKIKRERLAVGTIPTDKVHPVVTVPTNKINAIGTVLMDKMHHIGTLFFLIYFHELVSE